MSELHPRLPAPAPLDMPEQRFDGPPPPGRAPEPFDGAIGSGADIFARRALLVLLTLVLALAASTTLKESVLTDGLTVSDMLLLTVFFPLFALLAFGFINTVVGYIVLATGLHPGFTPMPRWSEPLKGRTAILMPVHNEDIDEVCGRLGQMADALAHTGSCAAFDFFILSDSAAENEAGEVRAWQALAARSDCAVYYRRRVENVGRKPGNIADWLRAHGAALHWFGRAS